MKPAAELFSDPPPQSIAVGTFDGLHPGHMEVLKQAYRGAKTRDLESAVLTFRPEPELVLSDKSVTDRRLLRLEDKNAILETLGFDRIYELEFTREFSRWGPDRFGRWLIEAGNAAHLSVGYNFRYGNQRKGTTDTLTGQFRDADREVTVVSPVSRDGERISSSRIRDCLKSGEPDKARRFMDRPYVVHESVQAGEGRGSEIGYPTINLPITETIHPAYGVYFCWAGANLDQPAVANFGCRPTVDDSEQPILEVHLLEPKNLPSPGEFYRVALTGYIREERDFGSIEELKDQIGRDVETAREQAETEPSPERYDPPEWAKSGVSLEPMG